MFTMMSGTSKKVTFGGAAGSGGTAFWASSAGGFSGVRRKKYQPAPPPIASRSTAPTPIKISLLPSSFLTKPFLGASPSGVSPSFFSGSSVSGFACLSFLATRAPRKIKGEGRQTWLRMGSNYRLETIKAEILAGRFAQSRHAPLTETQAKRGFGAGTGAAQR